MFTNLLNKSITVSRKTHTQSNIGEPVFAESIIGTYDGRVEESKRTKFIDGAYRVITDEFIFFFSVGVDIARDDLLTVDGKVYEVTTVEIIDGAKNPHHVEVYATIRN